MKFFLISWSKTAIYLSPGLLKGRPSYKRNLQSSKENIQHFKKWNLLTFLYFLRSFSPCWIRIYNTAKCDDVQITLTLHKPAQNRKYKYDLSSSLIIIFASEKVKTNSKIIFQGILLAHNILLQVQDYPYTSVIQGAIFLAEEKVHRSQRCKNKQRTVNTEKNTPNRDQLQTSLEHTLFTASPVCGNTRTHVL